MNFLAHLLSPTAMRLIALTLLHFLWQGTALAALAYAGMAFCRSASSRYAIAVTLLALMAVAPGITFFTLRGQEGGAIQVSSVKSSVVQARSSAGVVSAPANFAGGKSGQAPEKVPNCFFWLVEVWFAGVMLLGLRSAGGVLVVERLRRAESKPVNEEMLELCLTLQDKMGLNRLVRFCESVRLEAPAVVGWLRPAVMLPVCALTGLSEAQLSSVIAHELAHIKRFDALVNLFQIAVETLLFYHPAVWWLNKRIREERENCCDDMAVAVCGSPLTYAHALARMAESTASPRFMMAANSRPLTARVARLLGVGNRTAAVRGADLSLGLLCLSASLIAGVAVVGVARNAQAQTAPQEVSSPAQPSNAIVARPATPAVAPQPKSAPSPMAIAAPVVAAVPAPEPTPFAAPSAFAIPASVSTPQAASAVVTTASSSYIDGLKAAGLQNLTVDEIISLKIQGVTPEYVKSMRDLGLKIDADNLVAMKIQGVSPDYVREMRAVTGESLDSDNLIGMKIQGVTPEYVKQIHELGLKADADELVGMKIQGVSPEYIREMRKLEVKADTGELTGMKIQGITPEYVREINALGLHPDAGELIGMKVQGVDANYLKQMQAAGFKLDAGDAIGAKVMGVTPEFIEKARSHGFKDLSLDKLIALKNSGVLD
jgi:beta-lactamase regulating signal transducer with metallopeptidase domain